MEDWLEAVVYLVKYALWSKLFPKSVLDEPNEPKGASTISAIVLFSKYHNIQDF